MKTQLILLLASCAIGTQAQSLRLSAGESYSYSFTYLPFHHDAGGLRPSGNAFFRFTNDLFGAGDAVSVQLFDTHLAGSGGYTRLFTGSSNAASQIGAGLQYLWQDLEGAVRITVLTGSVEISSLKVESLLNGAASYMRVVLPPPRLSIAPASSNIAVSWPAFFTNYVLEASTNLSPPTQWQAVTNQLDTANGQRSVTFPSDQPARLFRLSETQP